MKAFSFYMPTKVVYGENCISGLPGELKSRGCAHILFVTEPGIVGCGLAAVVQKELAGLKMTIFDQVELNPTEKMIDKGAEVARQAGCDCVVALGGGSVLDSGKAIAMLMTNPGSVLHYVGGANPISKPVAPLFCIPTTAGTGSETTKIFVVLNSQTGFKCGTKNDMLFATAAYLDPTLTVGLPASLTATTGMDALSHAIEGYVTPLASNMTDPYNLRAIELVAEHLVTAVEEPANLAARGGMLLASCMTGCSFPQSGLGAVHSMAHALGGGTVKMAHGLACALCLPPVADFCHAAAPVKYAKIARILGHPDVNGNDAHDAALAGKALHNMLLAVGIRPRLADHGITESNMAALVVDTMKGAGMLGTTPKVPNEKEVEGMFKSIL